MLPLHELHSAQPGAAGGPRPIVLLHGFTQNARCWGPFDSLLAHATGARVLAFDAPGHGDADPGVDTATLWDTARLMTNRFTNDRFTTDGSNDQQLGPAHWIGYSMGGRAALHVALLRPELVASLTLIGATAGLRTEDERMARRAADDALASRIEAIGVAAFVDEWLSLPLFSGLTPSRAHRRERLRNRAGGLAASLRACGTGSQDDLWSRLSALRTPVQLIVGAHDSKFLQIAESLRAALSSSDVRLDRISDAGHTAHLEAPQPCAESVVAFLGRTRE